MATVYTHDQSSQSKDLYLHGLLLFAFLVLLRLLAIFSIYFFQIDEVSIAGGAAALVRGNVSSLYNYTAQLGYYRLVELIDLILGGHVTWIPGIMKVLSALAGAAIPVAGLFAFTSELTVWERRMAALILAIDPIIWKSSQYGNTAIFATALATAAIVVLSNRPSRIGQIAGLVLFTFAILVRADTVLIMPAVLFLIYRNEGAFKPAVKWTLAFGVLLLLVYGAIFAFDGRVDNAAAAVVKHMTRPLENRFWEYLIWSMSPIPFLLAIWGLRALVGSRPRVFVALSLWALPLLIFYFPAATIPRYFLISVVPLSIAAAVGVCDVVSQLSIWMNSRLAWTFAVGLTCLHLVVSMGHFNLDSLRAPFRGSQIPNQAGEDLPTGALIAETYTNRGILAWSLPHPQFSNTTRFWEANAFPKALRILGEPSAPKRTVIVLLGGGWSHAFHYHAEVAGAHYLSSRNGAGQYSVAMGYESWLQIGHSHVQTFNWQTPNYAGLKQFQVVPGDAIWVIGSDTPFPDEDSLAKLPPGMSLKSDQSFDSKVRIFDVTAL
jgi:hypothetical protein